jgi:hypothetical protein
VLSPCACLCAGWHAYSRLATLVSDHRAAFPIVLAGNQIADSAREMPMTSWLQSAHRSPGYGFWRRRSGA